MDDGIDWHRHEGTIMVSGFRKGPSPSSTQEICTWGLGSGLE